MKNNIAGRAAFFQWQPSRAPDSLVCRMLEGALVVCYRWIMFRMIGIPACALSLIVLAGTTTAQADAVLRIDNTTSDSVCVGDSSTPVCAVETWLACFARRAPALCEQVVPHVEMLFNPRTEPYFIEYQIADVLPVMPERITDELSVFRIKPGDMEVRARKRGCG